MRSLARLAFLPLLAGGIAAATFAPPAAAALYTDTGGVAGANDGLVTLSPPSVQADDIFQVGVSCRNQTGSACNDVNGAGQGWSSFIAFRTGSSLDTLSNTIAAERPSGQDTLASMTLQLFQGSVDSGALLQSVAASVVNNQLVASLSYSNLAANTDYYFKIIAKVTAGLDRGGWAGNVTFSAVPLPGAVLLFGSALAGLGWLRRRDRASGAPLAAV